MIKIFRQSVVLPFLTLVCLAITCASQAGNWQNNVTIGGFNNVHIYTPDTTSPIGEGKGLLIVLHGCTQSIDAYLSANLEDAAEEFGLVIAVPDAMNKAGFGCWSYWQGTKSRSAGDYKNLISLATTLSADTVRGIDANQVYIAGLSSGATFANTTACLAPDVFAGMGISAGPSIGTSSNGALGPCETADVQARCSQYGSGYTPFFNSQIASLAFGRDDTTVNQCYNQQNADGMAAVYGVSPLADSNQISEGSGRTADEKLWQDSRVSMLWFDNVDHAWSGGAGASGSYINGNGINYARYLGQYFLDNNQRVNRNTAPTISDIQISVSGQVISISGQANDAETFVEQIDVSFTDTSGIQLTSSTVIESNNAFSLHSPALDDDLYVVRITATDSEGLTGDAYQTTARVGPAPPPQAPVLSNLAVTTEAQCATVSGDVVDVNQDLASVVVSFDVGDITATVSATRFSATACNLPGGTNTAIITATDDAGLMISDSLSFSIDAGQTATLDQHISAARLDYTNYANCYLEYGTERFKLNETQIASNQCQWQDDDNSCAGPAQSCSFAGGGDGDDGSDPDTPPASDCAQFTTSNYYHKVAGRAYSTGNYLSPDYFANGSDDPMPGSTWGNTTLSSLDDVNWSVGACPQ
ncbi:PHB depolymerase family esterase [Lacimicrobium sp. SS2-24]|uniref:extracellular catalytic domain type 1 short-chain-length polyhydroxyalkanoate depolymerase n=1 Tax=Lacimicrobium sp. SS2-24 TaxID=2005569 RepID=UPI000B4B5AD9|nr:PHB depolymerase family esterase [Lacimicrobium sp. SS2-24]